MWIVRLALSRPYTFVVLALIILLTGVWSWMRTPKDIFPQIAEPIVTLVWQYVGVPADEFAKQITTYSEYTIGSAVSDVKRIESTTVYGKDVIRIYFHPNVRIDQAVSQITAISQTIIRRMLPGQTPPQIVQYDASSVPIMQIALGSDRMSEAQLYDYGQFLVRQLAPVQGAVLPLPYGGRPRLIMIDVDPVRMQAKGVTPNELNQALVRQTVNLPTGSTQIGDREYILSINNSPDKIDLIGDMPIKQTHGQMILIRDVADVRDGYNEQTNLVRHDGRKSALLTVLKSGGASTLDIIERCAAAGKDVCPRGSHSRSCSTNRCSSSMPCTPSTEGILAAALTGLLILLFLGSWRRTVIVVASSRWRS